MKNEKKYVVGYAGKIQTAIYTSGRAWNGGMEKMTFLQAKRLARSMPAKRNVVAVYELVPVLKGKPQDI